jgi:hypothetical protein
MLDDKLIANCLVCGKDWYNNGTSTLLKVHTFNNRSTQYWFYCHWCKIEISFWEDDQTFSIEHIGLNKELKFFQSIKQIKSYLNMKVYW